MTRWYQKLQTTDSTGSHSLRDRLSICQLALFQLPEEALSDIKEEMLYKIQWHKELANYDAEARLSEAVKPPTLNVVVKKAVTRPPFYLPVNDD